MEIIREILTWLCHLVYHDQDEEIMIEALWAFSYLTEGTEEVVDEVLRSGVARRITDSLLHTRVVRSSPLCLFPLSLSLLFDPSSIDLAFPVGY